MAKVVGETITGEELRRRIDALDLGKNYAEAAGRLGLTESGLSKAMTGKRAVGRQTVIIVELMELMQNAAEAKRTRRAKP